MDPRLRGDDEGNGFPPARESRLFFMSGLILNLWDPTGLNAEFLNLNEAQQL